MPAILEKRPSATELAAKSWRSLRHAFMAMPALYIGAFLIYGLMSVGIDIIGDYSALQHSPLPFRIAYVVLAPLILFAAMAIAGVATHRFIILDEIHFEIGRNTIHFLLWLVFVEFILLLFGLARILEGMLISGRGLIILIGAAIWIAKVVVVFHLALLFPSVAVGEAAEDWRDRIVTSWKRMSENFWLFLSGVVVAIFPLFLVMVLVAVAIMGISMLGKAGAESFFEAIRPSAKIIEILMDLAGFPILLVEAAIASWLYAWVRQQPDSAPEPPAAT